MAGLVNALAGTIRYSDGLDLITLAKQMQDIAAGAVKFATIPLAPEKFGKVDGQDIAVTQTPDQIKQFMIDLNQDAETPTSSESGASAAAPSSQSIDPKSNNGNPGSDSTSGEPAPETTTAANTNCVN